MAGEQPVTKSNRRFHAKSSSQWLLFVGDCRLLGDALAAKDSTSYWVGLQFLDALLRGYGQVLFCNNPFTGLLIAVALAIANPSASLSGLVAASFGLLVSVLTQQPRASVRAGLTVFNPLLLGFITGTVLPGLYGLPMDSRHWLYLMAAVVFCVYLTSALTSLLGSIGQYPLPCFAVPFITIQIMIFLCVNRPPIYNGTVLNISAPLQSTNVRHLVERAAVLPTTANGTVEDVALFIAEIEEAHLKIANQSTEFDNPKQENVDIPITASGEVSKLASNSLDASTIQQLTTEKSPHQVSLEIADKAAEVTTQHLHIVTQRSGEDGGYHQQNESLLETTTRKADHVDWGQVFSGVILSMTQVFGACNSPAAVLMFLGVVICSPILAIFCLAGAVLATLTGLLFCPAPYTDVYEGLWGFNGLLCAGGLGGFCLVLTWQSAAIALVCAVFTTCLQNVLNPLFLAVPIPVMSVPFNISILLFLCATAEGDATLVRPPAFSFAEKHRRDFNTRRDQMRESSSVSLEKDCEAAVGDQEKSLPVQEV